MPPWKKEDGGALDLFDMDGMCKMFMFALQICLPEFSVCNPGALFRKSLSNNIDFMNSASGVVYEKLRLGVCRNSRMLSQMGAFILYISKVNLFAFTELFHGDFFCCLF